MTLYHLLAVCDGVAALRQEALRDCAVALDGTGVVRWTLSDEADLQVFSDAGYA